MEAKQYLKQAYRLNEMINSNIGELTQLRAMATSLSCPNTSGIPPSGTRNTDPQFTRCIEKILELEKIINDEIDGFVDLKKEIRATINAVQDPNEKLLLKLRYIEFLKWEAVAVEMGVSLKQVHRIHAKALRSVAMTLNDTHKVLNDTKNL
jgi:predicted DNA-binding protein (UPF0251 family)